MILKNLKHDNNNFFRLFFVLVFITVFLISNISALGITPGRTSIDFQSGLQKEIQFNVINSEHKDMSVVIYVEGELKDYVTLSKNYEDFSSSDESKTFSYSVKLPNDFEEPGQHTADIIVREVPKSSGEGGTFVGATVAVVTELSVYVPYPGKYLELDPQVVTDDNNDVLFLIATTNRGEVNVAKAKAKIDVYNSENEKVADIMTDEISVDSKARVELVGKWTNNVQPGTYTAKITVIYDGATARAEKDFSVGEKRINIESIEVNDFKLGEIAKFEASVENLWADKIESAYLNLQIYNKDGKAMADIKSPTYDIGPLQKTTMIAYWDTAGVEKGNYDGKLELRYLDGSFDRDVNVKVSEDEILVMGLSGEVVIEKIKKSNLQRVLIVAVIILVAMNVLWFVVLRKYMKKRKK